MPAIKSIVPAAFFDVEMSLKAQESVVVKFTLLGYGLVTIALGALLTFEFSNKVEAGSGSVWESGRCERRVPSSAAVAAVEMYRVESSGLR